MLNLIQSCEETQKNKMLKQNDQFKKQYYICKSIENPINNVKSVNTRKEYSSDYLDQLLKEKNNFVIE